MSSPSPIRGLHHITAISGPPKPNYDFYTQVLGLRFVKKTVNFDDPFTYHLYYANHMAGPGSAITFFPWKNVVQGAPQTGEAVDVQYAVPVGAIQWWMERFEQLGLPFEGPLTRFGNAVLRFRDSEGMMNELVEHEPVDALTNVGKGGVEDAWSIRGFFGTTLDVPDVGRTVELLAEFGWSQIAVENGVHRYLSTPDEPLGAHIDVVAGASGVGGAGEGGTFPLGRPAVGRFGKGSIHHIAFRVADDAEQAAWGDQLRRMGFQPTPVQERFYFRSIYFREPGGVLFEIATDPPGFTADEPLESLGTDLKLPPWFEPHRDRISAALPEL